MCTIRDATTAAEVAQFKSLTRVYYTWLGVKLDFQGIEEELQSLPGKYAPPGGAILLAFVGDGEAVGCVALKPLPEVGTADALCCEMKRLFVKPEVRGASVGFRLVESITQRARELGYARIVLDTLPRLASASKIYQALGFEQCEPYYHNPLDDAIYFSKALV